MSTAREVGKGVAWGFSTAAVEKALALVNILIVLHYLSVYEYGVVGLVMSAVSLVGVILLSGLSPIITADLGVERAQGAFGKMKGLFHQYCVFLAAVSLIAFVILFFGAASVASLFGNPSIVLFLQVISFSFLLSPFRIISLLMATVQVRLVDQALYPMVEEVAKTGALLVCFFVLHLGPLGVFWAFLASQAIAILAFSLRTYSGYRTFAGAVSEGSHKFFELLGAHRKWGIATGYVGTLTQNAQLWIIRILLGTEAVGLYSFATGIMSNVASLFAFSDVLGALGPKYVAERDKFLRLIAVSAKAQFYLALGLIVAAGAFLPLLILLLPKYEPAVPLTLLMLLVLVPTSILGVMAPVFTSLKRQRSNFYSMLIKLLLTVLVMPLAIVSLGLLGIGAASIVINMLSVCERSFRLARIGVLVLELNTFFTLSLEERAAFRDVAARLPVIGRFVGKPVDSAR